MRRPNGLAFTPDGSRLIVANSDRDDPLWLSIEMDREGRPTNSSIWKSAKPFQMNGTRTGSTVACEIAEDVKDEVICAVGLDALGLKP